MANSFLKKTMVYLGLLDEEYDEYDDYDERSPRGYAGQANFEPEPQAEEAPERATAPPSFSRIRPLSRDQLASPPVTMGGRTITTTPSVRPMSPGDAAKVQVVAPTRFGDAKEIADCLKSNRPVIVNLQMADRDLQRRMIDFCSGVTYALSGDMEKVADQVFLLAPTNVKVSEEERQRLQERGFGRH
jgi:cell division inhibitor SepF